ncbi:molybdenum cofactor biosynthesis protein MoaE [Actinomyces slackii]|uniref:Molybdopterin synthase catalytic subunit n=1 Tax=Actinomyces slackii TaxID=52774 RepID=A0A3S4UQ98_9ACTO|nr:molybdenum cofactor biosynthesis protein MoaE [Actinomyces slackii]VEG75799.1 Molybdopterin synthase catalytic subunit [Actinomyces slackii]
MSSTESQPVPASAASAGGPSGPARVLRAEVTHEPISAEELAQRVRDAGAGAVVTFAGVVRDHDQGRGVTGIGYSAHPSADRIVADIAQEAAGRQGVAALGLVHRVGDLVVGDTALAVAVSAAHRAEAFATCGHLVEEVKRRLPVWKRQSFTDGSSQWSNIA